MFNAQDNASFGEETTAFLNLVGSGSGPCLDAAAHNHTPVGMIRVKRHEKVKRGKVVVVGVEVEMFLPVFKDETE